MEIETVEQIAELYPGMKRESFGGVHFVALQLGMRGLFFLSNALQCAN
jgi:hypothetical protein